MAQLGTAVASGLPGASTSVAVAYSTVATPVVLQTDAGSSVTGCDASSMQAYAAALQHAVGLGLTSVDLSACAATQPASGRRLMQAAAPTSCAAFAASTPSVVVDTRFTLIPSVDPTLFQPLLYLSVNTLFDTCGGGSASAPPPLMPVAPVYGASPPESPHAPPPPPLLPTPPPQDAPPPAALCQGACAASLNDTAGSSGGSSAGGAWSVFTLLQVVANYTVASLVELDGGLHDAASLTTDVVAQECNAALVAALAAGGTGLLRITLASVPSLFVTFAPPPPGTLPGTPAGPPHPRPAPASPPPLAHVNFTALLAPPLAAAAGDRSTVWWIILAAVGGAALLAAVVASTLVLPRRHKRKLLAGDLTAAKGTQATDEVAPRESSMDYFSQPPDATITLSSLPHPAPDPSLDAVKVDLASMKHRGVPPAVPPIANDTDHGTDLWGTDPSASAANVDDTTVSRSAAPLSGPGASSARRWQHGHGHFTATPGGTRAALSSDAGPPAAGGQARSPQLALARSLTFSGGPHLATSASSLPLAAPPLPLPSSPSLLDRRHAGAFRAQSMTMPDSPSRILRSMNSSSRGTPGDDHLLSSGHSFDSDPASSLPSAEPARRQHSIGGTAFNAMRSEASLLPRQDSGLAAAARPTSHPGWGGLDRSSSRRNLSIVCGPPTASGDAASPGAGSPLSAPESPIRAWELPRPAPMVRSSSLAASQHSPPQRRASFVPAASKVASESDMRRRIMQSLSRRSSFYLPPSPSSSLASPPTGAAPAFNSAPLSPPHPHLARWLSSELSAVSSPSTSSAPATHPSRFVSPSSPGGTTRTASSAQVLSPGVSRSTTRLLLSSADAIHGYGPPSPPSAATAPSGLERWLSGGVPPPGVGPPVVPRTGPLLQARAPHPGGVPRAASHGRRGST